MIVGLLFTGRAGMMKRQITKQGAFLAVLLLWMIPLSGWAQVDPSLVAVLMGNSKTPTSSLPQKAQEASDQLSLNRFAAYETKHLDMSDPTWNASDPNWKSIYLRIRTDLSGELPPVLAAERAAAPEERHRLEADIAAQRVGWVSVSVTQHFPNRTTKLGYAYANPTYALRMQRRFQS